MMDLHSVVAATSGELHGDNVNADGISTDSRSVGKGDLFIALSGERFDAHDFLPQVVAAGAAGAIVAKAALARAKELSNGALSLVAVADTRVALGALAAAWRRKFSLPVIAVTGSNGKTTTKDMVAAILAADAKAQGRDPETTVLSTQGNFNNEVGLPLTLLRLTAAHRAAVVELGMSHPGEIAQLAGLLQPTAAVVTNAQRAHLEGVGTLEDVAREKGSLFAALPAEGVAVVNADDPFAELWRAIAGHRRRLEFSLHEQGQVHGVVTAHGLDSNLALVTPAGSATLRLNVSGRHNAANALAAAAVTIAAGVSFAAVCAGLESFAGARGRLQRKSGPAGCTVIDDTYNANPDSVRAAIDVLVATAGPSILVLGDMGEIGGASAQYHDEVGGYAKSQGVDRLFALGDASRQAVRNFGEGAAHFDNVEALVKALRPILISASVVLVKGSRFMRMERVVVALEALAAPATKKGGA